MHESFHKDDPTRFIRGYFVWANTLFGELLWKTAQEKPVLLNQYKQSIKENPKSERKE